MTTPKIAWPSAASLRLLLLANDRTLGTATGFVAELDGGAYLVTNRHVLAGRDERNQPRHKSGAVPDTCHVFHNVAGALGAWKGRDEPLQDSDGLPLWFEHPHLGREVDVVVLPLQREPGLAFYAYVLDAPEPDLATRVAGDVSIVGFPFGLAASGAFGVWSRGSFASEPELDFDDKPRFLIDSRTRPGQSGSPVILYHHGGMVPMGDGGSAIFDGPVQRLLGVYSGRTSEESDLGFVWRRKVIEDVIRGRCRRPSFP